MKILTLTGLRKVKNKYMNKDYPTREFKFRYWNFRDKSYTLSIGDSDFHYHQILQNDGREIIQQFTGLYYKNLKEIYEGDILSLKATTEEIADGGEDILGQVHFSCGKFYLHDNKYDEPLSNFVDIKKPDVLELEIIGDNFENPELLTF